MAHTNRLTHPLSVTQTIVDKHSREGRNYAYANILTFGGAGSQYFLFDLSGTPSEIQIVFSPLIGEAFSDRVDVYVYEGTDYSGGSTVNFYNVNRNFSDDYKPTITTGATGSDKGTELRRYAYPASASGNNLRPVSGRTFVSLVANNSQNYLLEIEAAGATDFEMDMNFFEERDS